MSGSDHLTLIYINFYNYFAQDINFLNEPH